MDEHIKEILGAYMDGELDNQTDGKVKSHLVVCRECREELFELRQLSKLLRQAPPALPRHAIQNFPARVNLNLPPQPEVTASNNSRFFWLWLTPVAILVIWLCIQIISSMTSMVLTGEQTGLLGGLANVVRRNTESNGNMPWLLSLIGSLLGSEYQPYLVPVITVSQFLSKVLQTLTWQIFLFSSYLASVAILWLRQKRANEVHRASGLQVNT